jgi:hypothetical protein
MDMDEKIPFKSEKQKNKKKTTSRDLTVNIKIERRHYPGRREPGKFIYLNATLLAYPSFILIG